MTPEKWVAENVPFKIIYVIGQLGVGGTECQLLELVKHLDRNNFDPMVVSMYKDAPLKREFEEVGCPVYLLNREGQGRIRTLVRLHRLLRLHRPHIIHSFGFASRAAIPIARLSGHTKVIVSLRADPAWQIKFIDRVINAFADLIASNSEASKTKASCYWPNLPNRVIYNGIDLIQFDAKEEFDSLLSFPLQSRDKNICIVARLAPVKAHEVLLDAFKRIQEAIPETTLWIVGDGSLRTSLESKKSKLGLDGNVVFLGMRSDVPVILSRCAIGVLSSDWEGLPNAILEYMSAALPVVATQVGGNSELVLHGETGFLVPPGDPQAMAELNPLSTSRSGDCRHLGKGRAETGGTSFTIERMVRSTVEMYEDLIGLR